MDDQSGKEIRGFRLIKRIGTGRYSEVYQARQTTIGRDVAFKIIPPEITNQAPFIQAFETRAIALLEHPHITPLYDCWRSPDGAYLVSRLLHGGNLRTVLQNGPFGLTRTAALLSQVAAALWSAHRNQILHLRITPTNILFDEDGNAYLTDFAFGRELCPIDEADSAPDCLSPEEARGEPPTSRTDIYCLAVVLYEALTGYVSFAACDRAERAQRCLKDLLPPITTLPADRAEGVNAVIQRATSKRPEDRYGDVLALTVAFNQAAGVTYNLQTGQPVSGSTTPTVAPSGSDIVALLTLREQEVLQHIIAGKSNKQIAKELSVTLPTIKWHIRQIYDKLEVANRVQAILRARELPLITPVRVTSSVPSIIVGERKLPVLTKGCTS